MSFLYGRDLRDFCSSLAAFVEALIGWPRKRDEEEVELDSRGGASSPSAGSTDGSASALSLEDWYLYDIAGGTVAHAASASQGASAPRL